MVVVVVHTGSPPLNGMDSPPVSGSREGWGDLPERVSVAVTVSSLLVKSLSILLVRFKYWRGMGLSMKWAVAVSPRR